MSEVIKRNYGITRNGVRYEVELRIDVEAIAFEMVNNAARNSTGKSMKMAGAIVANTTTKDAS